MSRPAVLFAFFSLALTCGGRTVHCEAMPSVSLRGEITRNEVGRVARAISSGAKTLYITSGGGDAVAGLELGKLVRANSIRVVVQKYCISACASYVLPGSSAAEIEPQALIGLHNTVSSLYVIAKAKNPALAEKLYGKIAKEEEQYYRSIGIDPILLLLPQYEVDPLCQGVIHDGAGNPVDFYGASRVVFWAPNPRTLQYYGYRVIGKLPDSRSEVLAAYKADFPSNSAMTLVSDLGGVASEISREQIVARLSALPACPPGIASSKATSDMLRTAARMRADAEAQPSH